jgi:hypothetical protein
MKYIVTESQYNILLKEDRVDYLRNQNVLSQDKIEKFQKSLIDKRNISDIPDGELESGDEEPKIKSPKIVAIQGEGDVDLAYIVDKKGKKQIKLTEPTFQIFIDADPSKNKQNLQWIIDVFKKHAIHDIEEAKRFVIEDMDQATEALTQFDCVKNQKKFRLNAKDRPGAPNNPKDLRQYESVGQLYGVVSGFICGEEEELDGNEDTGGLSKRGYKLFKDLMGYAKLGKAKIHKLSDKMIVYQPQTLEASCEPLGSLANWCTRATPSGGIENETGGEWFHSYRGANNNKNRLRPTGELSDYYVIMPIELFQLETPQSDPEFPYQFHFESNQLHDNTNRNVSDDKITSLMNKYPELAQYFRKELGFWAAESVKKGAGLMDSPYITYLNRFGGKAKDYISNKDYDQGVKNIRKLASEQQVPLQQNKYLKWLMENTDGVVITDYLDENTETLDFSNMNLGKMPDLSKFTNLRRLTCNSCNIVTLPPPKHIPTPNRIQVFAFANNNIKKAPLPGYSEALPSCFLFNLEGNPLTYIDVEELNKMVNVSGLSRFTYSDNILNDLKPENKKDFEKFLSDDSEIGYFTG